MLTAMTHVRFATPIDAGTVLRLIHALAEHAREPDAVKVDQATLAAQMSSASPPFECLLAEDAHGETLGFALFFHTYSTWRGKRGIWLEDLFVLPEHRRRGVGRVLLGSVAALAHERDCARLEWSVLDWNAPAIDFYRQIGAQMMEEATICRVTDGALERLHSG
jgi:GNAT superfamily N-acetyltransferase